MAARKPAVSLFQSLTSSGLTVQRRAASSNAYIVPAGQQAHPIGGYYQAHLDYSPPIARDTPPTELPLSEASLRAAAPKAALKATTKPAPVKASPKVAPTAKPEPAKAEAVKAKPAKKEKSSGKTVQSSSSSPSPSTPSIVFGSRLNADDPKARKERLDALRRSSTRVLGVLLPPRPDEPDNCCMSGCVNCVWDTYREEMELWAEASKEVDIRRARRREQEKEHEEAKETKRRENKISPDVETKGDTKTSPETSSETDATDAPWDGIGKPLSKDLWDEELYKDIPVGIREFMRMEKKLKEPPKEKNHS